jgi:DNA excision repair protein ERCC-2
MDESILFPYEKIRPEQHRLINDAKKAIEEEKNLLVHAPTGIGKTIATLGPAIRNAIDKNRTVFFLTSRHTQHILAVKTLKDIMSRFKIELKCCDIIGKKWMCSQQGADSMPAVEFSEYCKALKEDGNCEFYENTRKKGKLSEKSEEIILKIKEKMPIDSETINRICRDEKLCPYEVATSLAREANVIIADYNYIFEDAIRDTFLMKTGKKLKESILIIDEGHNLPSRCREMLSESVSTYVLERAIKEAEKFNYDEAGLRLKKIKEAILQLGEELNDEKKEEFVLKNEFVKKVGTEEFYNESMMLLEMIGDQIREVQRLSFVGSVGRFMQMWKGADNGFCRTIELMETKYGKMYMLNYRCLDPSLISKDIVNGCVSTIIMSGTLTPVEMYADILGFKNYYVGVYRDPFSQKNRLNMIIDEVTTKFTARNSEQYKKIAKILSEVVNAVPGNTFVFFPSYQVRDSVYRYFEGLCNKAVFLEVSGMSKEEKHDFLEKFKKNSSRGAVMLGAAAGSFGEGVDLPGDLLKCVVVVGVPLNNPDLETKELIAYYEEKYGQGINYGYIYPAITKTMQNAGRCIRSETDRGVIVFMDVRYSWENYAKCFPPEWEMKATKLWKERIGEFFHHH